jgi:epidermal growth factor receptor substrate 15
MSSSSPSSPSTSYPRYGVPYFSSLSQHGIHTSLRALADTKSRGALDSTDFTVAMYMIQALMGGSLSFVPTTLPPGLYEQASGDASKPAAITVHATGGSTSSYSPGVTGAFPGRAIQQQYTGQGIQPQLTGPTHRPAPPVVPPRGQSSFIPPFPTPARQVPWDVTPTEKANADTFFQTLDSQKKGYIEGDVAVPFMLQSNLPEDVLAQVWCVPVF